MIHGENQTMFSNATVALIDESVVVPSGGVYRFAAFNFDVICSTERILSSSVWLREV